MAILLNHIGPDDPASQDRPNAKDGGRLLGYRTLVAGLDCQAAGGFLRRGHIGPTDRCCYIAVVRQQFVSLFSKVLPLLKSYDVSFQIPEHVHVHSMILDGNLGWEMAGKVITIKIENQQNRDFLAELVSLTADFAGPAVPTAMHAGGCVYVDPAGGQQPLPDVLSKNSWLKEKYLIKSVLKRDVKGNVYQALRKTGLWNYQWCVIKEGKQNQCFDDAGRTIQERLQWQFDCLKLLSGRAAVPRPIEVFEVNGHTYLVMSYIKGIPLLEHLAAIQGGNAWFSLNKESKRRILKDVQQVLLLLESFHISGMLHRDLSPANFIVTPESIVAIDIELSYAFRERRPDPAFTLGTPGYTSPQQYRQQEPALADDIYGLGGLLFRLLTGISPTKVNPQFQDQLFDMLFYQLRNRRAALLVCSCLHSDPARRPALQAVRDGLEVFRMMINEPQKPDETKVVTTADQFIASALASLWQGPLAAPDGRWYHKRQLSHAVIANELKMYTWSPGFFQGSAGIIYLLGLADSLGYDLADQHSLFYARIDKMRTAFAADNDNVCSSLREGSAGAALTVAWLIKWGLLEKSLNNVHDISRLLSAPNEQLGLADGMAGLGMAQLQCAALLSFPEFAADTAEIAGRLIRCQQKDGSWLMTNAQSGNNGVKHTGLFHGVAGMTCFLLAYARARCDEWSVAAAQRALNWLLSQRKGGKGQEIWIVNPRNKAADPWLEYGFTGIAWLFLKAYELLGGDTYQQAAIAALNAHPPHIASNYISQAAGIAGLGEVYLEAYRILREDRWLERASHIARQLRHCCWREQRGALYWLEGSETVPSPDLLNGTAGVIHFLLRYEHPKTSFYLFT